MANFSVSEIQNRVSAVADQSSSAPTEGGDDWNLRLKYVNMAQHEVAELYDWDFLFKEYSTLTSTNSANCSVALPNDYRKLATYPRITYDGANSSEFSEVRPQERGNKLNTDKYIYILGNPKNGYTMVVNPGTTTSYLASGASIIVPYYASVQSLVSPADISMVPDPNYLVSRTISYLWEAREDARFPQAKAEAEKILARMLEREITHSEASASSRIKTYEELRHGFRIGRD